MYKHDCSHVCMYSLSQDTVAALMAAKPEGEGLNVSEIDGVPLFDDRPIDFSGVGQNIDGVPLDQVRSPL